jgi:hypothetical protein
MPAEIYEIRIFDFCDVPRDVFGRDEHLFSLSGIQSNRAR